MNLIMTLDERLRTARKAAGFDTASAAAESLGYTPGQYRHFENGVSQGWLKDVTRISQRFGVRSAWLAEGTGPMRAVEPPSSDIAIVGYVGAVHKVEPLPEQPEYPVGSISLPTSDEVEALEVLGDSGYPQFHEGDYVLVEKKATIANDMLGHYAVVSTDDGRTLIKKIERGTRYNLFHLHSHNAPTIIDARILHARRVLGVLAGHKRQKPLAKALQRRL